MYNRHTLLISTKHIEGETEKDIKDITEEEFKELIKDYNVNSDNEYVWHQDDEEYICSLEFGEYEGDCKNYFFKILELGIYIAQDSNGNANHYYGKIGDTSDFLDSFLTCFTGDEDILMENIDKINWIDEEDDCFKCLEKFIKEHIGEDGEDTIEFDGWEQTSLDVKIGEYTGDYSKDYVIGNYLGKKIYEINGKLYYLSEDSGVFNAEYHWYLHEVSKKCYEYFKYEPQ